MVRPNIEYASDAERVVVDDALLAKAVERILSVGSPRRIILFGSCAREQAGARSDLDLLIVEDSSNIPRHTRSTSYRMALTGLYPRKDIVVYTKREIEQGRETEDAFITTVLSEGRVLYERSN